MGPKKVLGAKLVQNLITCLKMACAGASSLRLRVPYVVVVILEPFQNFTKENFNSATPCVFFTAHPPENGHFAGRSSSSSLDGMAMFWLDSH